LLLLLMMMMILLLLFINAQKCPVCGLFGPTFDRAAFCSNELKFMVCRDRVAHWLQEGHNQKIAF
jgi:hypothetical protein